MQQTVVILLFSVISVAWGNSAGAPVAACKDMTPRHDAEGQISKFPYNVGVTAKELTLGKDTDITISGKPFKGFLVQVRDTQGRPVGTFTATDKNAQTINCGSPNNAATHTSATIKDKILLKWKAPSPGNYVVYVTVVEEGKTFWIKQETQKIKVN